LLRLNAVVGHQFPAEGDLIRSGPVEIEDLLAWANVFLRLTVAVKAPFHKQRV
jgi:hypothetical protein